MDGLEIVEIQFKKLGTIIDYRIESEYFAKKFIENEKLILNVPHKKFNHIATTSNGCAYSSEAFSTARGIYISKIGDVTNKREIEAWEKVSQEEFFLQKGALLKDADILMTLTGDPPDVGKVNIVSINERQCTWNQRVAKIERLSNDYISNYALYAVLSSEICRMQMERFAKGIRQRNLGNDCFSFVELPILSLNLQKILDKLIHNHIKLLNGAQEQYFKAEQLLLYILDMSNFTIPQQEVSIKQFSESFGFSGRLDAEYYQLKYDSLFTKLNKYPCKSLGGNNGLVDIKKSIEPGSETYQEDGVPFVRVSDMSEFEITNPSIHLPKDYVDNIEDLYPKKDTILLSKDGSVGIAYKVNEIMPIVTSGAILHLTVKNTNEILPDYLTLVLNSQIVKLQAERDSNGAIIKHWKPSQIENVVIPLLDMTIQQEISAKVQKSFDLRKKSKQLLKYANQVVEMAIEQGENVAIEWLNEKVKDNGDR